MLRPERWGSVHIQRQSSHVINSQLRWGLRSKNSRPGELTASGAHDLAPKKKRDSVHYGGTSCIPPNGSPLRWRHLTENLEICVLDYDGIVHTFPLACHKDGPNWVDVRGKRHVDIQPTHWRNWSESH